MGHDVKASLFTEIILPLPLTSLPVSRVAQPCLYLTAFWSSVQKSGSGNKGCFSQSHLGGLDQYHRPNNQGSDLLGAFACYVHCRVNERPLRSGLPHGVEDGW